MATKVVMEALSPTMEEGRLVRWAKREGDPVSPGDLLAEVETDKAVMELAARSSGVLRAQLLPEGSTAPVGQLLAVIAAPDEDISSLVGTPTAVAATSASAPSAAPAPAPVGAAAVAAGNGESHNGDPAATERIRSSPLARRLASERGVDLTAISGTGPHGRVIKRDIELAASTPAAPAVAPPAASAPGHDYKDVPLTQLRRTIARRLAESIGPIPTFYLTAEYDVERVAEMRTAMAAMGTEYKVSFNDIVLKAVATALAQHPAVNAHWLGDAIRMHARVHLGMAVAVDDGLITPVIFDADKKGLRQIATESRELAARARARKLTPPEYTGSTFSISNLGMFGIDQFTAIINPPEAAILAIGAVEAKPVAVNNTVAIRQRMRVTLSCDHRVIDGATGAQFLKTLRNLIENPLLLVY
jgi:pyruvate dehydrogenase E2 component (dihydrolipoamide acetyltransferase)